MDDRQLGRWSFITFQGKNCLITTLTTTYCPVISSNPGSIYSQHLIYMSKNKSSLPPDVTCPRALFWNDLGCELDSLLEQGHQIILAGDFNSDIGQLTD